MNKFLDLLFNQGEFTCFTGTPHGVSVFAKPHSTDLFYSINPLHPNKDMNPTKSWHSAEKPRRADHNVTKFRNLCLEVDSMPVEEQRAYIDSLKIPYSAIVFSGGKSMHFLISLQTELPSYADYMAASRRLHQLATKADPSTKNPSRLSRLPNRLRPDTGKFQELIYMGSRVNTAQFLAALPELPRRSALTADKKAQLVSSAVLKAMQDPDGTMQEYNIAGRNAFFWWLHNRIEELGKSTEEKERIVNITYGNLQNKDGFSFDECLLAARVRG